MRTLLTSLGHIFFSLPLALLSSLLPFFFLFPCPSSTKRSRRALKKCKKNSKKRVSFPSFRSVARGRVVAIVCIRSRFFSISLSLFLSYIFSFTVMVSDKKGDEGDDGLTPTKTFVYYHLSFLGRRLPFPLFFMSSLLPVAVWLFFSTVWPLTEDTMNLSPSLSV